MDIHEIALDDIKPFPHNPRKGNIGLIQESLTAYGQYKPITVNKRTNEILAGNHTYQAAKLLGWETIKTVFVDADENTAMKIVLMDNKTSDVGSYENHKLLSLLDSFEDLHGTGYSQSDYKDLSHLVDKPDNGMTNVTMGGSLTDYAEKYAQRTSRIIMMDYEKETYEWMVEKLAEYRAANNLSNNSEAILSLIGHAFGETAPSKDAQ